MGKRYLPEVSCSSDKLGMFAKLSVRHFMPENLVARCVDPGREPILASK